MADQLHTHGEIYKIHPNGRIVYKSPYVDQVREFVEHLPANKYTNTYLQQISVRLPESATNLYPQISAA